MPRQATGRASPSPSPAMLSRAQSSPYARPLAMTKQAAKEAVASPAPAQGLRRSASITGSVSFIQCNCQHYDRKLISLNLELLRSGVFSDFLPAHFGAAIRTKRKMRARTRMPTRKTMSKTSRPKRGTQDLQLKSKSNNSINSSSNRSSRDSRVKTSNSLPPPTLSLNSQ